MSALLLDTHALLWWLTDSAKLPRPAFEALDDPAQPVMVSAASAWEIATKHRLGKLRQAGPLMADLAGVVRAQGFEPLPITLAHALRAGTLAIAHRDPFDRVLIAQALIEDLTLVSNETVADAAGVRRLWLERV